MSMLNKQLCQECNSVLIDDEQNGETICTGCGIVTDSHTVDYQENTGFSLEEKLKNSRATGQNTYSQHDLGVSTVIGDGRKDFSGKMIDRRIAAQMNSLRNWQKRIRVAGPTERRLASALSVMGTASEALNLPRTVLETASILYRNIDGQTSIKGKSVEGMAAAILYMACKQCGVVRTIEEIATKTSKSKKPKTRLASRYYRNIVIEVEQIKTPAITTDQYISKYANMIQVDTKILILALEIAKKTQDAALMNGKSPHGVAAAYLYMSSILLGQGIPQREISTVAEVTEVTIRNRCREILANYEIQISLKPSAGSNNAKRAQR